VAVGEILVGGPYDGQHIGDLPCEESPDRQVVRVIGPPEPARFEPERQGRRLKPREALKFTYHEYVRQDDDSLAFRRSFRG
jgi:hypothetical protein